MENALPSQYHSTMRVVTQLPPTSLRDIQHRIQKTDQQTKLIQSYSDFKKEVITDEQADEELDPILDTDEGVTQSLENAERDIFEIEEIKLCNLTKKFTAGLIYSREIPMKSMQIQAWPFNKEKSSDQIKWRRLSIYNVQEDLRIVVTEAHDPHFVFELILNKESYLDLQKTQSINTSFTEFAKRLATLLDYCLL